MKFLVATDGSTQSEAALEHALDVAAEMDATLTAVHAVDPSVYADRRGGPILDRSDAEQRLVIESIEDAERRGRQILDDAIAFAEPEGVAIETEILYGDPVETIPEFAESNGFDGVFAGHRDLAKSHERVLGSVAKGLIDRTSLPVTIVR